MRSIMTIAMVLIVVLVNAQSKDDLYDMQSNSTSISSDTNYLYLKRNGNQIIFERIYNLDTLNASQIESILVSNIPNISDVSDFQKSSNIITFTIKGVYIDYKKYGLSRWNMNGCLAFPMTTNVSIVWKDGKYKITASNITFNVVSFGIQKLSTHLLRNNGNYDERKPQTSMGHCVENYLSEKFNINLVKNDW